MMTKIWGPPMWTALHSITFGYPVSPTNDHKKYYKTFFESVGDILPCRYCRESYKEFITESGQNYELTDSVFDNRESLSRWLYNLHNRINNKRCG